MCFNRIWQVISLTVFFATNVFSGEEILNTLSPDHPQCCRSKVHMLIHWKESLSLPDAENLEAAPLASENSAIYLNIGIKPGRQGNTYDIVSKEFPTITGGSQTYLMLPEICYSLDLFSGKIINGIEVAPKVGQFSRKVKL